ATLRMTSGLALNWWSPTRAAECASRMGHPCLCRPTETAGPFDGAQGKLFDSLRFAQDDIGFGSELVVSHPCRRVRVKDGAPMFRLLLRSSLRQ
ncbi:MAG: hypothetical protein WA400_16560, partial [Silvibacterium sp.]